MKHIVITGRIGTGKTTYAEKLTQDLTKQGKTVLNIDYDDVAHEVLSQEMGITTPEERQKLAREVFANTEKRQEFENRLHPLIYDAVAQQIDNSPIVPDYAIHQIPLYNRTRALFCAHFGAPTKVTKLKATDDEIVERLTQSRNMTVAKIKQRLDNQKDV